MTHAFPISPSLLLSLSRYLARDLVAIKTINLHMRQPELLNSHFKQLFYID